MNESDDPRLTDEHVRTVSSSEGTVTLVGVVHDHPASKYRVRTVVTDREPAVLALELPPLALPLFEQYARDERTPPVFGGEMSAAVQAMAGDRVVGIDGPTVGFLRRLAGTLYRQDVSLETTRNVVDGFLSVTKQTLRCRTAAHLAGTTGLRLEVDTPTVYETDWSDDPETQATDEQRHLDRASTVLGALETPRAMRIRDQCREAHMAERIEQLRREGDVVAVVGQDHLDAVTSRLAG